MRQKYILLHNSKAAELLIKIFIQICYLHINTPTELTETVVARPQILQFQDETSPLVLTFTNICIKSVTQNTFFYQFRNFKTRGTDG